MDRRKKTFRRLARIGLAPLALWVFCGCQTVRTPENEIAARNLGREKNMVSQPDYVVGPPDIIQVEVLEALPGRPISGERLVRPDGTITLGFYGDIYVAGLTLKEIKEKIVIHLRKYVSDESLGLVALRDASDGNARKGDDASDEALRVHPADSDRVSVDVASYNSQVYYVLGDVNSPGRLPLTGNETVLDALQFAGGLDPSAATNNIRLVRPAPPGACCAQTLPVNIAAIQQAGDPTTNYQLMPGDRIFVYRDPIVRTTILINRLAAPFNTVVNATLTYAFAARSVKSIGVPINGAASTAARTSPTAPTISAPSR
jgi:polysaccharide biosynthesis/export protein